MKADETTDGLRGLDGDLLDLGLLGLGNGDREHAIARRPLDLIGPHTARQCKRAAEATVGALQSVIVAALALFLFLTLDGQDIPLQGDLDVLVLRPGSSTVNV